jgi:hypothetical protein
MERFAELPGVRVDNAGLVTVPVATLERGCRGAACPAFARCQGRCQAKRASLAPSGELEKVLAG